MNARGFSSRLMFRFFGPGALTYRSAAARVRRRAIRGLTLLGLAACVACTGGQVKKNGQPVANTGVSIWTCDSLGDFVTSTDGGGIYAFNPFRPDSPALDLSKLVPPGPIAINVTGGAGSTVVRRNHQYDDTCRMAYNGSTQDVPCKLQNINLVPMSIQEFLAEQQAFLEEDCGLAAEVARDLSLAAQARPLGSIGSLTSKPSSTSCLSDCADSCIFNDASVSEHKSCLCGCAEKQCEASFGPICRKSGD